VEGVIRCASPACVTIEKTLPILVGMWWSYRDAAGGFWSPKWVARCEQQRRFECNRGRLYHENWVRPGLPAHCNAHSAGLAASA
jgi:hypothetical protein